MDIIETTPQQTIIAVNQSPISASAHGAQHGTGSDPVGASTPAANQVVRTPSGASTINDGWLSAAIARLAQAQTWTAVQNFASGLGVNTSTLAGLIHAVATGTSSAHLILEGAVTASRGVLMRTGATNRWLMQTDGANEAGSNAGSDLRFKRYDDSGAFIADALVLNRANGYVTMNGARLLGAGTAFPTAGLLDTDLFYHTSRRLLYYWYAAGSLWLTLNEYPLSFSRMTALAGYTATGFPVVGMLDTRYRTFATQLSVKTNVLTTNNTTNYWTADIRSALTNGGAVDTLQSWSSINDTAGAVVDRSVANNIQLGSTAVFVLLSLNTKVGAPGAIIVDWDMKYRLVG